MSKVGISRKVDELGRVVLPIEIRRALNIEEKDTLDIYIDGQDIVMRKQTPVCQFCGGRKNVVFYKDKGVCQDCLKEIKKLK